MESAAYTCSLCWSASWRGYNVPATLGFVARDIRWTGGSWSCGSRRVVQLRSPQSGQLSNLPILVVDRLLLPGLRNIASLARANARRLGKRARVQPSDRLVPSHHRVFIRSRRVARVQPARAKSDIRPSPLDMDFAGWSDNVLDAPKRSRCPIHRACAVTRRLASVQPPAYTQPRT